MKSGVGKPKKEKRYNHGMDLGFEVISTSETKPTPEEIMAGLEKKVAYLKEHPEQLNSVCGLFDTIEEE